MSMMPQAPSGYVQGSTITYMLRIAAPGTKQPIDPLFAPYLESLYYGNTPVTLITTTFTRAAEGQWTLVIPTLSLSPGTYTVVIVVSNGGTAITKVTDTFVVLPS